MGLIFTSSENLGAEKEDIRDSHTSDLQVFHKSCLCQFSCPFLGSGGVGELEV